MKCNLFSTGDAPSLHAAYPLEGMGHSFANNYPQHQSVFRWNGQTSQSPFATVQTKPHCMTQGQSASSYDWTTCRRSSKNVAYQLGGGISTPKTTCSRLKTVLSGPFPSLHGP